MPGSIQSIERAAAVLELIAAGPQPLRLAEVCLALQLPKGTAHGILRTLCEVGYLHQDRASGRYELGSGLRNLGSGGLDVNEMRARSMNWADPLAARTGLTVRVGMLGVTGVRVVHYVFRPDDTHQISDVGAQLPAHATALGKMLLAYNPGAVARLPEILEPCTARTLDRAALTQELHTIRRAGHAVDFREHVLTLAGVAAPVFGQGNLVVAAVAVHGDADEICDSTGVADPRLTAQVVDCARAVTRELETARASG